ncbi:MAG: hypothetical protein COA97_07135 [Flavobacteriales bacterium]|nr:MAG: hypothetical protein COA97_07135 [Flavobacteriales bacterium]
MASAIVPANDIKKVLNDPFGFNALIKNKPHGNPNRFFIYFAFSNYFKSIPLFFQKITNPIDSVYLSAATIKLLIQILIIYIFSRLITNVKSIFNMNLLMAMVIITPLFQTYGYHHYMGIIDESITYTFFYALPLLFLILFYYPFYMAIRNNERLKLNFILKIVLALLIIILPFSGPLIPPIILIVSLLLFIYYYIKTHKMNNNFPLFKKLFTTISLIPKHVLIFFIPISLFSIYSMFLGSYNQFYQEDIIPISVRYSRLPIGIYYLFTQKLGYLIVFTLIITNILIIKKYIYTEDGRKVLANLKWVVAFSLIYILLLPLGGYRFYRENIIRYDTFMPITLCLIYIYGISSYIIIKQIKKRKTVYISLIFVVILIFTNADRSELNESSCERSAFTQIEKSNKEIVLLKQNCKVLSWETITDYDKSELNTKLLLNWNIIDNKKLYYSKP